MSLLFKDGNNFQSKTHGHFRLHLAVKSSALKEKEASTLRRQKFVVDKSDHIFRCENKPCNPRIEWMMRPRRHQFILVKSIQNSSLETEMKNHKSSLEEEGFYRMHQLPTPITKTRQEWEVRSLVDLLCTIPFLLRLILIEFSPFYRTNTES